MRQRAKVSKRLEAGGREKDESAEVRRGGGVID